MVLELEHATEDQANHGHASKNPCDGNSGCEAGSDKKKRTYDVE